MFRPPTHRHTNEWQQQHSNNPCSLKLKAITAWRKLSNTELDLSSQPGRCMARARQDHDGAGVLLAPLGCDWSKFCGISNGWCLCVWLTLCVGLVSLVLACGVCALKGHQDGRTVSPTLAFTGTSLFISECHTCVMNRVWSERRLKVAYERELLSTFLWRYTLTLLWPA